METRRMVVVDGMAEFVDDHVIAQVFGQGHQKKAQRNGITPRTTPPLGTRSPNRELGVFQPRRCCDSRSIRAGKIGFGGPAQLFDAGFGLGGRKRRDCRRHPGTPYARGPARPSRPSGRGTAWPCGPKRRTEKRPARHPVPRTLIEMRRARRVRERVDLAQPGMRHGRNHRISTALIDMPCITTAESVRSNLIFSNRIRQRSSR